MPAQENQDPYQGEDPSAIAKELGISLKALEGVVGIVNFNTPLGIRLSLRYGLETLAEAAIAQRFHEELALQALIELQQAVTERLRQEINYINQQPYIDQQPVPERLPQEEIEYFNEPEQEPGLFDTGVGQQRATDGPPNLTPPSLTLSLTPQAAFAAEGISSAAGRGPASTVIGYSGLGLAIPAALSLSRGGQDEFGALSETGPPASPAPGTSGAVGDASPEAP